MKGIHKTLSAAVLGTLLTGSALAQTATTPSGTTPATPASPASKEQRHEKMRERHEAMAQKLGLTDDQKTQLQAIHQDMRTQAQAIKNDTSLTPKQKRERLKALHQDGKTRRDAILTPEQRQKMDEWKESRKGKRGHMRRHGRGHRPDPNSQ